MDNKLKYSRDGLVVFDPVKHTYTRLSDGKLLTSVTSVIRKIETPFDQDGKSKKKAIQLGITQEEVLKMWKDKADIQINIGNRTHSVFEDYYLKGTIKYYNNIIESKFAANIIQNDFKSGKLKMIASEFILHNEDIAGQLDCLALTHNNELVLIDFKTNEKLNNVNYNTFFLQPFSHIPQSKMSIYTFQLNIYKAMFNKISKKPISAMYILHINKEGSRYIPIPDISHIPNFNLLLQDAV